MSDKTKKQTIPFNETSVKKIQPPASGRLTVYDSRTTGLCVMVSATGNKSFYVIKKRAGKTVFLHLGKFPAVATVRAQQLAKEALAGFADPANDPQAIKRSLVSDDARAKTEKIARDAVADKVSLIALCNAYGQHLQAQGKQSAKDVLNIFAVHLTKNNPALAAKTAKEITREDVNELIKSVAVLHRRTANKLRSYMMAAYNLPLRADSDPNIAVSLKQFGINENPVKFTMPLTGANKAGDRSLNVLELQGYYRRLLNLPDGNTKDCLLLGLLLGGQRVTQLLRVTADSFDRDKNVLEILDPKGKRTEPRVHVVPLAGEALVIVKRRAAQGGALFTSNVTIISQAVATLAKGMVKAGEAASLFRLGDIRRTAETHLAELKISKDVRAQLLSHGLSGVQSRHYERYEFLAEKSEALAVWVNYLDAPRRKVEMVRLVRVLQAVNDKKASKPKPRLTRI